jgi:cation:H+ antiporter
LCILGITALVSPIGVSWGEIQRDVWVMLGVTVLLVPFLLTGRRLSRLEGTIFLAIYIGYVAILLTA